MADVMEKGARSTTVIFFGPGPPAERMNFQVGACQHHLVVQRFSPPESWPIPCATVTRKRPILQHTVLHSRPSYQRNRDSVAAEGRSPSLIFLATNHIYILYLITTPGRVRNIDRVCSDKLKLSCVERMGILHVGHSADGPSSETRHVTFLGLDELLRAL
jgi:hypothetical protein